MWRTIIVNRGEKITVNNNRLVVYSDNVESKVPIEDIYALMIDNRNALVSVATVNLLSEYGVPIYWCNEKHIPIGVTLPIGIHYKPYAVLKSQFAMTEDFKGELWRKIVQYKIHNQCLCLKYRGIERQYIDPIEKLEAQVTQGDEKNREAIAARMYFKTLFGNFFSRWDGDITNAALNYGYTIMRTSVAKTLVAYGYNCTLGIHHSNERNAFNLADDLMEPLRPLVDMWVDENCDDLFCELTTDNRKQLINLVNVPVLMKKKKTRVRYAIDEYISSLTTAIKNEDADLLVVPQLIRLDLNFEDDEDG